VVESLNQQQIEVLEATERIRKENKFIKENLETQQVEMKTIKEKLTTLSKNVEGQKK
jgi:hypothetical protein